MTFPWNLFLGLSGSINHFGTSSCTVASSASLAVDIRHCEFDKLRFRNSAWVAAVAAATRLVSGAGNKEMRTPGSDLTNAVASTDTMDMMCVIMCCL